MNDKPKEIAVKIKNTLGEGLFWIWFWGAIVTYNTQVPHTGLQAVAWPITAWVEIGATK